MTGINRRTFLTSGALALGATALPVATGAPALAVPSEPTVLAEGLRIPWSLTFLPNGNALTGERDTRRVYRVFKAGGRGLVGRVEGGATKLFGLALSPTYSTDHLLYAHVLTATDARILRMTWTATAGLGAPEVVFSGIPRGRDHHGGGLLFGPHYEFNHDLFVSVGDKGKPWQAPQKDSLAGKILRIRSDGSVPTDNPFGTTNPVWSRGHRNVEAMTSSEDGTMYSVEFGEDTTDEMNRMFYGGHYGWPAVEGGDGDGPFRDPYVTWSPTSTCSPAGIAAMGGYAYVGALQGQCVYRVRIVRPAPDQPEVLPFFQGIYGRIRAVQAAPDGSVWFTTSNNDPKFPSVTDDRVVRFLP